MAAVRGSRRRSGWQQQESCTHHAGVQHDAWRMAGDVAEFTARNSTFTAVSRQRFRVSGPGFVRLHARTTADAAAWSASSCGSVTLDSQVRPNSSTRRVVQVVHFAKRLGLYKRTTYNHARLLRQSPTAPPLTATGRGDPTPLLHAMRMLHAASLRRPFAPTRMLPVFGRWGRWCPLRAH